MLSFLLSCASSFPLNFDFLTPKTASGFYLIIFQQTYPGHLSNVKTFSLTQHLQAFVRKLEAAEGR
jgi:hypothetical protein